MTIRFPFDDDARGWRGVVLALDETASGRAAYRVKLWRGEAALVCLLETFDGRAAISEWTARAEQFGLPKFIERAPGLIEGAEVRLAQALAGLPAWRRRGATLANRRPAILSRREASTQWRRA